MEKAINKAEALFGRNGAFDLFSDLLETAAGLYHKAKNNGFGAYVVGEGPVLFFGDLDEYLHSDVRIMTLGRAAGRGECDVATGGVPLFPSALDVARHLVMCGGYFTRNPNAEYLRRFTPLLQELCAGYVGEEDRQAMRRLVSQRVVGKMLHGEMPLSCYVLERLSRHHNIVVHFNYSTPFCLDRPWEALDGRAREALGMEEAFPRIFEALSPNIVICDFNIEGTWLAEGTRKSGVPDDWELAEAYRDLPAYERASGQYVLVFPKVA